MTLEHGGCQGKEDGRELERRRSEGAGCKNPDESWGSSGLMEVIFVLLDYPQSLVSFPL